MKNQIIDLAIESWRLSKFTEELIEDRDITDQEKFNDSLDILRAKRNIRLNNSDWTQSRDVNLSNNDEWTTYRQSLRDITKGLKTIADIEAVTWPTKPK